MAVTLTGANPQISRQTLSSANQALEVNLSASIRKFSVQFITNAGKVGLTGTDGAGLTAYVTIPADTIVQFEVDRGMAAVSTFYVESATSSTVCEIVTEA